MTILDINKEEYQIKMMVEHLFRMLRDRIAPTNEHAVLDDLYKFFRSADVVLINKSEFKMYQELEKLAINCSLMTANNGLIPND